MTALEGQDLVRAFWARMNSNDWAAAAALFAPDIVIDWPLSGERIVGASDFIAINTTYPAAGPWRFDVLELIGTTRNIVTRTNVTDGVLTALALSLFEENNRQIARIVEYWPEPYQAPPWRAAWVQPIGTN